MKPETKAAIGAILIIGVGAAGRWANGYVYSSAKAIDLIDGLAQSALYLGSAMAASSGTTLALMLTLVGFINRMDGDFDHMIYERIDRISFLSTISLAGSVIMLLALTLPVGEFDKMPPQWYSWLYNIIYSMVVVLSALLVATVVLLYATIRKLIAHITPSQDV